MNKRSFLKYAGVTGTAASVAGSVGLPSKAMARGKEDIGECKSVKVTVLSETSWFNNDKFKKDIVDNGGASTNQYNIPWDRDNSGGYAALIEVEQLDGKVNKFLLDTGWNNDWMDLG